MEKEFWLKKWLDHKIGFHQVKYNNFLVKHWPEFAKDKGTVFVPLCGKSKDMLYFLEQGHKVIGVEFSEIACEEFFKENHLDYEVLIQDDFTVYISADIKLYCGDILSLKQEDLEDVNYIFDRASLVALPHEDRVRYADFMMSNLPAAKYFLITFEFDNPDVGPPFSINEEMVKDLYSKHYKVEMVKKHELDINLCPHSKVITYAFDVLFFLEK